MGQFPKISSSQKSIDNSSYQISVYIVGILKSLAQIVKNVNLILKRIKTLVNGSGIQKHSRNTL